MIREKKMYEKKCKMRAEFNKYNNFKFTDFVKEADLYDYIKCAVCVEEYSKLKNKKCMKYIRGLKIKERIRYYLLIFCPRVFQKCKELKDILKKL